MTKHYVAIVSLTATMKDIESTIKGLDAQIAPLALEREKQADRLRSVKASLDALEELTTTDAPGVEYSPADGEQPRRIPKLLPGERLQFDIPTAPGPVFQIGSRVVVSSDHPEEQIAGETVRVVLSGSTATTIKTLGVSGESFTVLNEYLTEEKR